MKLLYYLAYFLDLISYPLRFIVTPQSFKNMWGLRDVMLLQIYYQQISKEQQKLYQEKINKEMKANELRIRALEQGIDDGEDI